MKWISCLVMLVFMPKAHALFCPLHWRRESLCETS